MPLLGGTNYDHGFRIAVDGGGNAYVTGGTDSSDFPTTPGAFDTTHNGGRDGFVTKLNADGSALVYSTFLGGSGGDYSRGIGVDGSGNAYLTGFTGSSDFPTTPGAFDTTYSGAGAFMSKLNADGSALAYSTFLSSSNEYGYGLAVDGIGNAYVTGFTSSSDYPTTPGAFDPTHNGGDDTFVTKLNADGSALFYSTILGGPMFDAGGRIAVDRSGNAYIAGGTESSDFPTTPGTFDTTYNGGRDAFVTKLSADGSALVYSTYLGGSGADYGRGIDVDIGGNAYLTGYTISAGYPTAPGAFDTTYNGGGDVMVTKLNADGSALAYSTFLGGSAKEHGSAIATDGFGNAYVTGWTRSTNFPTTPGAFDTTYAGGAPNAFVTKFCERACGVPAEATQVVP